MDVFTDPASGRQYTVDPTTGESRWLDEPAPLPQPSLQVRPSREAEWSAGQPAPHQGGRGKKLLLVGGGALVLVIAVASLALRGDGAATTAAGTSPKAVASSESASGKPEAKPGTGTPTVEQLEAEPGTLAAAVRQTGAPVREGKLEFTVTATQTATKVGSDLTNKIAQGEFVLLSIKVRNIGEAPRTFDTSGQFLLDSSGHKYNADAEGGTYLEEAKAFLEDIQPGSAVSGILIFEVPEGATIDRAELHDTVLSPGVRVKLAK